MRIDTKHGTEQPAVYESGGTGIQETGTFAQKQVEKAQEGASVNDQQNRGEQASDTNLTGASHNNRLDTDVPLRVGKVLVALPYVHCYKVQLSGRTPAVVATALTHNSMMPTGVRSIETIPPNSQVLVWQPKAGKLAYIVGVIPVATMADSFNPSDHLQQGGNSGPKKTEAVRNIPKAAEDAFSWVPQSSGRPMDGTHGEWGRMSETGIGILIDSFQAYLRVNEVCGLWLNYFDNYAKLAALSLNIMSYCENVMQTYDEGENFSLVGHCTFPWEATGMYGPNEKFSEENDKEKVQLEKNFPFAEEDLEDFAQTPVYRLTDYSGYMGQGWNRTLMLPAQETGKRLMTDGDQYDKGLFNEFLALDGSYSLRSRKSILIAKYPVIPNPRRIRAPEDAKGDDLTEDNDYKFSGEYGNGDEHKSRDWDIGGVDDLSNLMRPAGLLDFIAHHYNWKSTFPFYYHKKDYNYPTEPELTSSGGGVQAYVGNMSEAYVDIKSASTSLKISKAYGEVDYYNTASFFSMTDDGSVVIADGYGSQILMAGGQIRLETGGDIMLMSNSRVVTLSREAIIRTKQSIDISSSERDVRLKAENNFQMLGGSLLLEATNVGSQQDYEDKLGEKVQGSGITFLSKGGSINGITQSIYWRTGIDENGGSSGFGDFVIDADNGFGRFVTYAAQQSIFAKDWFGIWHQPQGRDDQAEQIDKANFFSPYYCHIEGPTIHQSGFTACGDQAFIAAERDLLSKGGCYVLERMACREGIKGLGDSSQGNFEEELNFFMKTACEQAEDVYEIGKIDFQSTFPDRWWQEKQPGDDELIENQIGFSYRDESETEGKAYSYKQDGFFILEPRYLQLGRADLVSVGGSGWQENPVEYQGKKLYPWPGKINWEDNETLLRYKNSPEGEPGIFRLFDKESARSRQSFQGDYEEPVFEDWDRTSPNLDYKM